MEDKLFTLTTEIKNIKSHYSTKGVSFKVIKPITVIAGPNGEGKSNLLEAILFGIGNFIERSTKLKEESSFSKKVTLSQSPYITTSYREMLFTDLIKKGLHPKKSEINLPERLSPKEVVTFGKRQAEITTIVKRVSGNTAALVGKSSVIFEHGKYKASIEKNKLKHLDLIYINTDNILYDFFVKYIGQEYTNEISKIAGTRGKTEYYNKILNYFPNENDRLIRDVDSGKFEEKYNRGKFLTSCLPTGAKKECLLYAIGILNEKHKEKSDWLSVILIDEIEAGLHISRNKKIIDAIISAYQKNEVLQNHIKIILTTHSPVIYSELQKHSELVDTYFILREPNNSSIIYKKGDVVENKELFEKRILTELGLNVYELPNKILFVEGPTDKLFFEKIFKDAFIQPFYTCNISRTVRDFISSFPIVRSKEYSVLVDKNGLRQIQNHINEIQNDTELEISFKDSDIGCNSLEEFIFDIDVSGGGNVSTIWNKIESKINTWNQVLVEEEKININFQKVRTHLEPNGREGLRTFLEKNIKKNQKLRYLYSFIGCKYKDLLSEEKIDLLKKFARFSKIKLN
jgi:AAA15 family ATPase/GTPase